MMDRWRFVRSRCDMESRAARVDWTRNLSQCDVVISNSMILYGVLVVVRGRRYCLEIIVFW